MIHPAISLIFSNDEETKSLFSWICSKIKQVDELEEFIKWHLEVNKDVIKELTNTQKIDFSKDVEAKKWARSFLKAYEEKIRGMRHISNQVFERFHKLNEEEFKRIISDNKDYEEKMTNTIQKFLNKKELLIGKIIFAYREIWFLANQIHHLYFNIGYVKKYKEWNDRNFPNLQKLDKSLGNIHCGILKWKQ